MMQANAKKRELKRQALRFAVFTALTVFLICLIFTIEASAASITVDLGNGTAEEGGGGVLDLIMLFAVLALLPSILIMMTSFTRIIIVMSFLRNALGTQQSPPNQVLIGISLFLTLFIMSPVLGEINTTAYEPYKAGQIEQQEALDRAMVPLKRFMLKQTKVKDLQFFLKASGQEQSLQNTEEGNLESLTNLDLTVIIPSFMTSELKRAFIIGFYLFLPFLIIDLVVSSTLMSMGMVMLPPSMIALPFKIMMFVLVDGWQLLFGSLISGFH